MANLEFLAAEDVADIERNLDESVTLEQATGLVERVIAARRDSFIAGMARAEDPDFRAGLFKGALDAAYYRTEEDVYLAVALTAIDRTSEAVSKDEHQLLWDVYLSADRAFKMLGREKDAMLHFVSVERQLEAIAEAPVDELLASDDAVTRAVGLVKQALDPVDTSRSPIQ